MSRIVVIGTSAGGVSALQKLAAGLPSDFPAPILTVLHIGTHPSVLPQLLTLAGPLPADHAVHGTALLPGRIYVAPPDHHMTIDGNTIRLSRGPKEHHARPAIDPLFLSAAMAYRSAVIGVILTGMLDDGTAGLQAIKECGGVAVVQDPDDALAPSMPLSALRHVEVDHCIPLSVLPRLLVSLATMPAPAIGGAPTREVERLKHEQAIALAEGNVMEHLASIGTPSTFVCPDCHGDLWEINGANPPRYRCHTGHAFSLRSLQHTLSIATDEAIWNALRALQEKSLLLQRMARFQQMAGAEEDARIIHKMATKVEQQVSLLRNLLEQTPEPIE